MYATVFRDPSGDSICRVSSTRKCIVNHSLLNCPFDSIAILIINGEAKLYKPGRWPITTGEFPFFVNLRNAFRHGDAGFDAVCFYVPQQEYIKHLSMGTGEVLIREDRFGQTIRVLGAFDLDLSVADPMLFIHSLVGGFSRVFNIDSDLKPRLEALILPRLLESMSAQLSGKQISEVHRSLRQISDEVMRSSVSALRAVGLTLRSLSLKTLTINDDDLKRMVTLEEARAKARVELANEKARLQGIYDGSLDERRKDALVGVPMPNGGSAVAGSNPAVSLAAMALQLDYLRQAFPNGLSTFGSRPTAQTDDHAVQSTEEDGLADEGIVLPPPERRNGHLPPPHRT